MLSDNIKNLRKSKGLSQDELAIKLNVVRQTISKWENGLSIPDSEMLIHIADELDTSVNMLLDKTIKLDDNSEHQVIAKKLEILNQQIAQQNESRRRMWRIISIIVFILAICCFIVSFVSSMYLDFMMTNVDTSASIIGGADGPTTILVSNKVSYYLIIPLIIAFISMVGIYKTRKK